jgi:hypothetical protein
MRCEIKSSTKNERLWGGEENQKYEEDRKEVRE